MAELLCEAAPERADHERSRKDGAAKGLMAVAGSPQVFGTWYPVTSVVSPTGTPGVKPWATDSMPASVLAMAGNPET